jgi:hypothetical protein
MSEQARSLALVLAGIAFVVFLLAKLLLPRGVSRSGRRAEQRRLMEAQGRARDHALPVADRAAALRDAAAIALDELRRPGLAASYARRAERLDPRDGEAVGLLASALRQAARFRALERLLWRRLGEGEPSDAGHERALRELISLYEGPLKRPEIATGLRKLAAGPASKATG